MNCEICGRQISSQAFRVKVEGAKLLVCGRCQQLGKPYEEERVPSVVRQPKLEQGLPSRMVLSSRTGQSSRIPQRKAADLPKAMTDLDVADDLAKRVQRQRMKLGLSQEDLARRVKEKLSFIQKIETGRMTPNMRLCRELEHALKVKLLVPPKETPETKTAAPVGVTFGDLVRIKGREKLETSD